MPSYFFHIAFELYPTPPPSRTSPQASPQAVYVPSSTFDLFADALPTHGTGGWKTHHTLRKVQKSSKTTVSSVDASEPSSIATRQTYQRRLSHLSPGDRTHRPVPFDPSIKTESEAVSRKATLDWRFDSVAIQSIDMNPVDAEATRGRGKSVSDISRVVVSSGWSTKGKFIPGDPKNTNVGWGVVHLYRDGQETPGLYDEPTSESGSDNGKAETGRHVAFNEDDCKTLCILAVPSYMTPSDFLGWVGEQTREDVSNFRLIRTGSANKYMVLMKFRDAKKARQWRKDWNGKLFNSMEVKNLPIVPSAIRLLTKSLAGELPCCFRKIDSLYCRSPRSFQLPC
jgi:BRCA1-associated protein